MRDHCPHGVTPGHCMQCVIEAVTPKRPSPPIVVVGPGPTVVDPRILPSDHPVMYCDSINEVWAAVQAGLDVEFFDRECQTWRKPSSPPGYDEIAFGWWRVALVDKKRPDVPKNFDKCDHLIGEHCDEFGFNHLVRLSQGVKDMGLKGTFFKFCPDCGIEIAKRSPPVPLPGQKLTLCSECRGIGWLSPRVMCPICKGSAIVETQNQKKHA